ncbi:WD repeat and HMG-box DNA-binding protein 1-like [Chelonus insularis]|uniref:WD repeat and HMG-box DNA-binding protein 1-like n=1 Tax=Chelonus insularis TaxID=460826 RepID=UPI001588F4FE|nr:WD repeat and HMG-box DNA-binding protein 1-like [Chelonus insularis]
MALKIQHTRYAHSDGHTDVCYFTGEKGGFITCGADGDARFWVDLMDDDPSAVCVAEQAIACIAKNNNIYVGNDNNTIQILTYPNLDREGIVARFDSAVSALDTRRNSNLIVSGSCNWRIKVNNIETHDCTDLEGHEAPILGLSLDPKEEFVASSSADGSIKVWNIKEKKSIHTWNNIVPKCNSFFTAKALCTPSFNCKDGSTLAYPHGKDVIIIQRETWKEINKLKCPNLKAELNICKYSECGSRLAACSVIGEIVVWDTQIQQVIGYTEHPQNVKVTAIAWNLKKPVEIAFCDSLGQLGCVTVSNDVSTESTEAEPIENGHAIDDNLFPEDDDDDDGENVISLNKIKTSVNFDDDQKSVTSDTTENIKESKQVLPEIYLQEPFQPGSTPAHLLSRFMMFNDVGMVKCYQNEEGGEASIEVEFHDTSVHNSMHIVNYLNHTLAALSTEALALSCQSNDGNTSKLVVIALQGWGPGNKEWTIDFPEGEESECIAAGDNFVALATSRRNLRLFMVSGIQREIIAIPGSVVAMNALKNCLIVAYHTGVGASKDQQMNLMWIQIRGINLKSRTLSVPLSPAAKLMWLGLSDLGSPVVMDSEGVIKIFNRQSNLWRVAADTDKYSKGKLDNYFIITVSETERCIRCILCKGSYYPPTTPRPIMTEIPLTLPLCELESEKTKTEAPLWQIGSNPSEESRALLALIAFAHQTNTEFRAVDLCQHIAPLNIIELAIRYASQKGNTALVKKLQNIAEEKNRKNDEPAEEEDDIFAGMDDSELKATQDSDVTLTPLTRQTPASIEIRPLTSSIIKRNPFLKKATSSANKGLEGLNSLPEKPQKIKTPTVTPVSSKQNLTGSSQRKGDNFVQWYLKNKADLQKEFPDLKSVELGKIAKKRFEEESSGFNHSDTKKRKLSDSESSLDPIQDAMGVMGPWQIIITLALSLINFPAAWHQLSISVLAPKVNYTCISPSPSDPKTDVVNVCEVIVNNTEQKCTSFDYDTSVFNSTIISEWNLVCDRKQLANLVQLLTQLGILIGNMSFGIIADKIGRKIPLMIAVIVQSLIGMLSAFMPMYELFVVFKFISAIATGGTMLISFVIFMEIVGIEWRSKISVLFHIPFILGFLSVSGISWLTGTWDGYLLAVSVPPFILISYYWLIPESPRWLLAVGKVKKARKILEIAAKKNKIPQEKVNAAIEAHENEAGKETDDTPQKTYNILDLLRTPNMRIKTICITFNWLVCGICFFGLNQYLSQFGANVLINIALSATFQLPGIILVYFLISRMSRLKILIGANLISGISLLLIIPLLNNETAKTSFAILGVTGMTVSFPTIYLYTGELFPTVVRNIGFGVCSVSARVGSMIAPFIATIGESWIAPLLFGVGPIIGAGLCYFLPETMDCKLPETIEDGENFKRKSIRTPPELVS